MRPELLIQNEMISLHEICFIQRASFACELHHQWIIEIPEQNSFVCEQSFPLMICIDLYCLLKPFTAAYLSQFGICLSFWQFITDKLKTRTTRPKT